MTSSTREAAGPLTDRIIHDRTLAAIDRRFPDGGEGRRLLDAPAGTGSLARELERRGFRVAGLDIDPGHRAVDLPWVVADLNRRLPFVDGAFDAAVSVAGLHRLVHPDVAVPELARVVRPGGTILLALPNHASLRLRVRYLLHGSPGHRFDRPAHRQSVERPAARVRRLLGWPRVASLLAGADLELRAVHPLRDDLLRVVLLWPLALVCWLGARWKAWRRPDRGGAYPRGTTLSMLASTAYLVVARRPEGSVSSPGPGRPPGR